MGFFALAPWEDSAGAVPLPKPRPGSVRLGSEASAVPVARITPPSPRFLTAATDSTSATDLAAVKEAISAAKRGNVSHAMEVQTTIEDPLARKLVEWAILRADDTENVEMSRYTAFLAENPSWPAIELIRRRAEATLWTDRLEPAFVRSFFAKHRPATAKGKFALARALLLQGDRAGAQSLVRDAWRNDAFSNDLEAAALDIFQDLITSADHKARMDMRLYAEDVEGALRAADRAGGNAPAIAKARIAVIRKASNAKALLDAVPSDGQRDLGLIFSRVQLLRRAEKATEAAALIVSVPREHTQPLD